MSMNEYPGESQQKKSGAGGCLKAAGIGCLVIVLALIGFGIWAYNAAMKNPAIRSGIQQTRVMTQCSVNLATLTEAFSKYAADHNGNYPAKLADLYPKYVPDQGKLQCPSSAQAGAVRDYEYIQPAPTAPENAVVVVCRHHFIVKGQPPMPIKLLKSGKVDTQQQAMPQQQGPQTAPKPAPVTKP